MMGETEDTRCAFRAPSSPGAVPILEYYRDSVDPMHGKLDTTTLRRNPSRHLDHHRAHQRQDAVHCL